MRGNRGSGREGDESNWGKKATATFWAVAGEEKQPRLRACRGGSDLGARWKGGISEKVKHGAMIFFKKIWQEHCRFI